ncbi:hypothetical protein EVAR_40811_1 [Eumeta japonica]|uniref:Uncharacterized protein n=1 Tax=Eumeta variegata TaxID=151549 RepID=A0A4C1WIU9_EUMVA|nr:hypothetical protein EVAR_40811_1 [Eumeta japonica]
MRTDNADSLILTVAPKLRLGNVWPLGSTASAGAVGSSAARRCESRHLRVSCNAADVNSNFALRSSLETEAVSMFNPRSEDSLVSVSIYNAKSFDIKNQNRIQCTTKQLHVKLASS